jgi:hypothetical protein
MISFAWLFLSQQQSINQMITKLLSRIALYAMPCSWFAWSVSLTSSRLLKSKPDRDSYMPAPIFLSKVPTTTTSCPYHPSPQNQRAETPHVENSHKIPRMEQDKLRNFIRGLHVCALSWNGHLTICDEELGVPSGNTHPWSILQNLCGGALHLSVWCSGYE